MNWNYTMKYIFLILLIFQFFSCTKNQPLCFSYFKNKDEHVNEMNDCKKGDILDFRVYKQAESYEQIQFDKIIFNQTKFCNYDKTITTTFNAHFFGFTCVLK